MSRLAQAMAPTPTALTIASRIQRAAQRHSPYEMFSDFLDMGACAISNVVDPIRREAREAEYLRVARKYSREGELALFPELMGDLAHAMEAAFPALGRVDAPLLAVEAISGADVLGGVFNQLEVQNRRAGQFFTPYSVCRLMAMMSVGREAKDLIAERGYFTAMEPACGSGSMLIAMAHSLVEAGLNPQKVMHATAVDVDIRAVQMAYIQLSLLGIPAVIIHGNSLSLEEYSAWLTPAHVLGRWPSRLGNWGPRYLTTNEPAP